MLVLMVEMPKALVTNITMVFMSKVFAFLHPAIIAVLILKIQVTLALVQFAHSNGVGLMMVRSLVAPVLGNLSFDMITPIFKVLSSLKRLIHLYQLSNRVVIIKHTLLALIGLPTPTCLSWAIMFLTIAMLEILLGLAASVALVCEPNLNSNF